MILSSVEYVAPCSTSACPGHKRFPLGDLSCRSFAFSHNLHVEEKNPSVAHVEIEFRPAGSKASRSAK
jgi:hypothetical protein